MSLTDAQLFQEFGPRCYGKSAVVSLNGRGKVTVAPVIVEAVKALNAVLIAFAYLTRAADTGAFNCRQKVGGNGWSIHSLKIALDINWQSNPYGRRLITDYPPAMVRAILAIRTNSGAQVWTWGGNWSGNKDAMHWQIGCTLRDLATGIDRSTVHGATSTPSTPPAAPTTPPPYVPPATNPTPAAPAAPTVQEDDMRIFVLRYNSQPLEVWQAYGGALEGFARNLNQGNGEADSLRRCGYPVVELVGDLDCSHWKNSVNEISYAQLKARRP